MVTFELEQDPDQCPTVARAIEREAATVEETERTLPLPAIGAA